MSAWGLTADPADTWREDARCRPANHKRPEIFYPLGLEKGSNDTAGIAIAKAFCRPCPVRMECLAEALRLGERWGVWGGLTPAERAVLRRPTPPPEPKPRVRMRWCVNGPHRFEPDPAQPKGRLCPSCRAAHTDRRVRAYGKGLADAHR